MCGIAGSVNRPGHEFESAAAQLACLEHRGPDAAGAFELFEGTVGQTRLAVIDLITGDPPTMDEEKEIGAVLNGEIYNFRALRDELERAGHRLRTTGDTEVIAHLAEDHEAVALARRLDGMFAFAVWDTRRRRLVLGRDRLGKKPLYYWAGAGRLVFASELKAVIGHPWVPRSLDPEAIPAYLGFGYVPCPRTFYEGVCSVPPGCVLTFSPGGEPVIEHYWEPPVAGLNGVETLDLGLEEAAHEVARRVGDAVERRLVADVPLGAFLSGGIDSSLVVAMMVERGAGVPRTFTAGFGDAAFDERGPARRVAQHLGTDHTEFEVRPDAAALVEQLLWHHDQPFGDSSALPTYLLSQLTRQHVTVALCGDGGDELFAGYQRFAAGLALGWAKAVPAPVWRLTRGAAARLPASWLGGRMGSAARFLTRGEAPIADALTAWVSFVTPEWRASLVGPDWDAALAVPRAIWARSAGARPLDRMLDLNLRTYLLDDLLPKVDRMAMAHALEVRSPFLDTELVEFALRLPPTLKVRGLTGKRVLRHLADQRLPAGIAARPKQGFGVPLDRWFRAELAPMLAGIAGAPDARLRSHLDGPALDGLLAEHASGRANHGHALWALLTLELFLRREDW